MTRRTSPFRPRSLSVLLVLAAGLGACVDDEAALPVELPEVGGELFLRYVAMGNSITAGFQSGGLNVSLQEDAYPVLLAAKAGAGFGIPALATPGCPPPLVAPLTDERVGSVACAYRLASRTPPVVQNVAVPGALIADATDIDGPGANFLSTLLLGGRTQAEAMRDADPTFVSVWLGNNDALGAALSGDTTRLTTVADFEASLDALVAEIVAAGPMDALVIGVARPALAAPAIQPGAYFWAVAESGDAPVPLVVADNCAPGQPGATHLVSFRVAEAYLDGEAAAVEVDCADDAPYVLNDAERAAIDARVAAFNALLAAAADEQDWMYVDPLSAFILPALDDPSAIRKCQDLEGATTAAEIAAAVEATCPQPDAPNFFGAYFSFDGVHPSAAAHAVIADSLARRINQRHGLELPIG